MAHLEAHVARHGPYDGIFGFSAGALVATIASSKTKKRNCQWRFVIAACSATVPGELSKVTGIAGLHLIGGQDPIRTDSEKLLALYERQQSHVIPYATHSIPIDCIRDKELQKVVAGFLDSYRP